LAVEEYRIIGGISGENSMSLAMLLNHQVQVKLLGEEKIMLCPI